LVNTLFIKHNFNKKKVKLMFNKYDYNTKIKVLFIKHHFNKKIYETKLFMSKKFYIVKN